MNTSLHQKTPRSRLAFYYLAGAFLLTIGLSYLLRETTAPESDAPSDDIADSSPSATDRKFPTASTRDTAESTATQHSPRASNATVAATQVASVATHPAKNQLLETIHSSWSHDGLEIVRHPDGRRTLLTHAHFIHAAVARTDASGATTVYCGEEPALTVVSHPVQ